MPATINSAVETKRGEYALLELALPGRRRENVGVLLLDPQTHTLHQKLRRDWLEIADPEDYELLRLLADDLAEKARELGAEALLNYLEDTLSHTLRISDREPVLVHNYQRTLDDLYRRHIHSRPLRFETHLPVLSFRPAAGGFGEETEPEEIDLLEMPEDLPLTEDMFVVRISGRSMEPLIQDGDLCVFRYNVRGSRVNRRVLVVDTSQSEQGGRYTVKVYRSKKTVTEEGWRHDAIWLEPLNPEYPPIPLDENASVRVIAEFVRVL